MFVPFTHIGICIEMEQHIIILWKYCPTRADKMLTFNTLVRHWLRILKMEIMLGLLNASWNSWPVIYGWKGEQNQLDRLKCYCLSKYPVKIWTKEELILEETGLTVSLASFEMHFWFPMFLKIKHWFPKSLTGETRCNSLCLAITFQYCALGLSEVHKVLSEISISDITLNDTQ